MLVFKACLNPTGYYSHVEPALIATAAVCVKQHKGILGPHLATGEM